MRNRKVDDFEPVEETGFLVELKRNWLVVVIVLVLGAGAYITFGPKPPPAPPSPVSQSWQAMSAPQGLRDFGFIGKSGNGIRVSSLYGRPKIVMGYQLECDECRRSLQTLDRIIPQIRRKVDVITVAISTRSQPLTELIEKEFEENGIVNLRPFTITADMAEGIFNRGTLPHTYVTDPNNQVVRVHTGAGNWDDPDVVKLLNDLANVERAQ